MTHFAIVAPPLPGHYNPLLVLARELVRRGHRATFLHMADAEKLVAGKGADFAAVGQGTHPPGTLPAYLHRLANPTGLFGLLGTIRETAGLTDMLCRDLPRALKEIGGEAMICDQTEPAGTLVARHLGLPVVSTATALPLDREAGVPPPFVPWPYDPTEKGLYWNKGGYQITNLLMKPMTKVVEKHGAQFGLDHHENQGFSGTLTVAQMPGGLDFPRKELPATFHYGAPWRDAASPVPETPLDLPAEDGRPLVFCSFGTLQGARADLFLKVAKAARDLDVRLLIAHGGLLKGEDEARLAKLAMVRSFVPQRLVLERCTAAILHCGLNTVLDALSAGVPLVAMPIAFEQPATAARIAYAGVGEVVPAGRMSVRRMRKALEAVLANPAYKAAAVRLQEEMARSRGVLDAADLIEKAVGVR